MDGGMINEEMRDKAKRLAVIAVLIVGYILAVKYILPLTWPLVAGFIIAKTISPFVKFLKKHLKIADGIASAIILTLVTGVICAFIIAIGILVYQWVHSLILNRDTYENMVYAYADNIFFQIEETFEIKHGVVKARVLDICKDGADSAVSSIIGSSMGNSVDIIKQIISIFIAAAVLYASIVFMAKDLNGIDNKKHKVFLLGELMTVYDNVISIVKVYFKSQLIIMVITAIICSVTLLILQIDNGVIVGILIGLLDALPMIGVGIILIPWSILSVIEGKYFMAIILFAAFVVCNLVREIIEPKLMGDKVGIHPVVTLASIFIGYKLFGVIGFILGPIGFIIIKIVYEMLYGSTNTLDKNQILE